MKEHFMIAADDCRLNLPEKDFINMEYKFEKS